MNDIETLRRDFEDFKVTMSKAIGNGAREIITPQIRSSNFKTGVSGYQINDRGAEFNNGTFRGTFVIGGTLITVNDIANLQTAINTVSAAGGGTVALVPAIYFPTSNITIPSNVLLDMNGATLDFASTGFQVLIQGTSAYSTGTLSVNYASAAVTGVGTTWTAGMVGQSILIGDYWYTVASRISNTSITISPTFQAPNVSGVTYVIATTIDGASILNGTLANSTISALKFRYCNGFAMDGLSITGSAQAIDGQDSANVNWLNASCDTCTVGMVYSNVPFCTFFNGIVKNITGGAGMSLTGVSNTSMGSISWQAITGVGLKYTNCYNLGLVNFSIIETSSHGLECVSGNNSIDITVGYFASCGGDGLKLTATNVGIATYGNTFLNNGGYGINMAASSDTSNQIVSNYFSNNTSGSINDLGVGTIIEANSPGTVNVKALAHARATAQAAANTNILTATVGANDTTFEVLANVLVTTSTTHSFSVTVDYTDESNTSRTLTIPFSQLAGTIITAITNATGASAYEGVILTIRAKAATSIVFKTAGTFTSVAYNVDVSIVQIA